MTQAHFKLNLQDADTRAKLTPMMQQYWDVKLEHSDCLLFYRMGDFYELFFEDAITASKALGLTLTKRGQLDGQDIPMCGVPFHAYDGYLSRLIKHGHKVGICEQTETPAEAKKRDGHKALVRREVIRIVTPGTLTEESLLDARQNNYLASVGMAKGHYSLSWLDISTGQLNIQRIGHKQAHLWTALNRLEPREIFFPISLSSAFHEAGFHQSSLLTPHPDTIFDAENAKKNIKNCYGVEDISVLGDLQKAEISSLGGLLSYVSLTQKNQSLKIQRPVLITDQMVMEIDPATRRNLEINRTLSGERSGSLLHTIDHCITAFGARLFSAQLNAPLTDVQTINERLDGVEWFFSQPQLSDQAREFFKSMPDIERALSRLMMGRGGPRDLKGVEQALAATQKLHALLQQKHQTQSNDNVTTLWDHSNNRREPNQEWPTLLSEQFNRMQSLDFQPLRQELAEALKDDLPLLSRDGGFIREGYSAILDEFRNLQKNSRQIIASLQKKYADETNVQGLKIKHNNVLGYFIDVTALHAQKLFDREDVFIHRQTLANNVRFTTTELSELAKKITEAEFRALATEQELFDKLVAKVMGIYDDLKGLAQALAQIDVSVSLAHLAKKYQFCRPVIDQSLIFDVQQARHPVVERALHNQEDSKSFIPNDCQLVEGQKLWLLTGPNMAGKSTFLRQNALITILAQMGSFVPAEKAHIGVVDKLFSRVGAADDLARGQSTFMVEMVETATILNQATERSLVILDEIGRGTATFDGLSIAWGTVEYLHDISKTRGLFATHYHELTQLVPKLENLKAFQVAVKEWKNDIVFLHTVKQGSADRSYGIHVAKIAGLPSPVISRAQEVLETVQKQHNIDLQDDNGRVEMTDLAKIHEQTTDPKTQRQQELMKKIDPDSLTPREALQVLYDLKESMDHE